MKAMVKRHPGSGGYWRYWTTIQDKYSDFLPHRTPDMLRGAWKEMKAKPGKKYPKRGEEKAPTFAYTRKEDAMLRGMATKFWRLDEKYSPRGYDYWELIRLHKPNFLHWRTTSS